MVRDKPYNHTAPAIRSDGHPLSPADYDIGVWVKNGNSSQTYDQVKIISFTINNSQNPILKTIPKEKRDFTMEETRKKGPRINTLSKNKQVY